MRFAASFCTNFVLDASLTPHSIVENAHGVSAVVVRVLSRGEYMIVPKYIESGSKGRWRSPLGIRSFRLLDTYSPSEVWRAAKRSGVKLRFVPQLDSYAPTLVHSEITLYCHCGPQCVEYNLTLLCDVTEGAFCKLAEILGDLSGCMYLTGSLLHGSFIPGMSDIDIVVDISSGRCYSRIYELREELERYRLRGGRLESYIAREAKMRGIPLSLAYNVFQPWTRLLVNRVEVSITLSDMAGRSVPPRFSLRLRRPTSLASMRVKVPPLPRGLGDFPSVIPTEEDVWLVVYDGFYTAQLLVGGEFNVKGLKATLEIGSEKYDAVVVGVREQVTYIAPLR